MARIKKILFVLILFTLTKSHSQTKCISGNCFDTISTIILADSSKYIGEFKDGVRAGKGTLVLQNGTKYTGDFQDDTFNGWGSIVYSSGNTYFGEWKDGKRNGKGQAVLADGERYIGNWENNMRNGFGESTVRDTTKKGFWEDDEYIGEIIIEKSLYPEHPSEVPKVPINQFNSEGKPTGLWVTFYPNDNSPWNHTGNPNYIRNIGVYKNGVKDGTWRYYNENFLTFEENYHNGIKNGKQVTCWFDSGQPRYIENYKTGKLDGLYQEFGHGYRDIILETNYLNGYKNGEQIEYYNSSDIESKIMRKSYYKNGNLDGDIINYNRDGSVASKSHYENGVFKWDYDFENSPRSN